MCFDIGVITHFSAGSTPTYFYLKSTRDMQATRNSRKHQLFFFLDIFFMMFRAILADIIGAFMANHASQGSHLYDCSDTSAKYCVTSSNIRLCISLLSFVRYFIFGTISINSVVDWELAWAPSLSLFTL